VVTYGLKGRISLSGWQLLLAMVFIMLNDVVRCLMYKMSCPQPQFNQRLDELRPPLDGSGASDGACSLRRNHRSPAVQR
jgi:hypothetical protein